MTGTSYCGDGNGLLCVEGEMYRKGICWQVVEIVWEEWNLYTIPAFSNETVMPMIWRERITGHAESVFGEAISGNVKKIGSSSDFRSTGQAPVVLQ